MAYLTNIDKNLGWGYRYIATTNLSEDFTCFLFTPKDKEYGAHIDADTNRYRIRCTGVERWEVKDLHENLILNIDYQTKTFAEAYDLLCNYVNNLKQDD